jgi:hypothetical protein
VCQPGIALQRRSGKGFSVWQRWSARRKPAGDVTDDRHTRQISHRSCPSWLMCGHLHTARYVAPRYHRDILAGSPGVFARGGHEVFTGYAIGWMREELGPRAVGSPGFPSSSATAEVLPVGSPTNLPLRHRRSDPNAMPIGPAPSPGCFRDAVTIPGAARAAGARARTSLECSWLRQIGEGRSSGSRHSESGFPAGEARLRNRNLQAYESGVVF